MRPKENVSQGKAAVTQNETWDTFTWVQTNICTRTANLQQQYNIYF